MGCKVLITGELQEAARKVLTRAILSDCQQKEIPASILSIVDRAAEDLPQSAFSLTKSEPVTIVIPKLDKLHCQQCGRCLQVCDGAIQKLDTSTGYTIRYEFCHACLRCIQACGQRKSLTSIAFHAATMNTYQLGMSYLIEVRMETSRQIKAILEKHLLSLAHDTPLVVYFSNTQEPELSMHLCEWADVITDASRSQYSTGPVSCDTDQTSHDPGLSVATEGHDCFSKEIDISQLIREILQN